MPAQPYPSRDGNESLMGLKQSSQAKKAQRPTMPASSIKLPGFGLPLSAGLKQTFEENGRFPHAISDSFCIDGLTLREARMLDFINQITDKPRWTEKINDEAIVEKWRNEACGTDDSWVWDSRKLSPNCFDYCLAELRDKADYAQKHGLIHVLECSATIVKKDLAEDDHFCQDLGQAVEVLEDVPEHRKDWHPYTNGLVLDLLHPSLHPLKYGMSRVLPVGEVDLATCMTSTGCGAIIPVPPEVEGDVELERKLAYGDDTSLKPWGSYQWLPTDITFDDNGKAKIESYINNLHPQRHTELYPVLREAVDRALPLWEECLSYFNDRLRIKVEGCGYADYILPAQFEMSTWDAQQRRNADAMRNEGDADEVMQDEGQAEVNQDEFEGFERLDTGDETPEAPAVELNTEEADEADDGDEEVEVDDKGDGDDEGENESTGPSPSDLEYERDDAINDWLNENPELRQIKQPEPNDPYTPFAERAAAEELQKLDFRTKFPQGLQVIFKLANIELTPDNPKYEGSSWHVEGALNEHICATALLYYSSDNISDSRLDFRSHVDSEAMVSRPEQNEYLACEDLYGITQEGIAVQDIGSVLTREGRWLAFPNVMQHRVAPFGLADKSHPGHRKILAMFLVDPHIRVLSTANVPPQRVDWWADEVRKIGRFARLPQEVFERIIEGVEGFPFSWAEALEMREALMEERGRQKDSYDEATGQDTFYFCEH